jgi:hypothetical protein
MASGMARRKAINTIGRRLGGSIGRLDHQAVPPSGKGASVARARKHEIFIECTLLFLRYRILSGVMFASGCAIAHPASSGKRAARPVSPPPVWVARERFPGHLQSQLLAEPLSTI